MEKTCEFCGAPQPVVHCQADAALLCLSCDSKVHSANALFSRHSRTLLCDSCKGNPAYVRCLDHSMLICQQCDSQLHKPFTSHKKLLISSFTGCPSAKHFATLWGIDVNELDHLTAVEASTSVISIEPEIGSFSQHHKKLRDHQQKQNNSFIMHQILDLKNLQLTDEDNLTKPLRHKGEHWSTSSMAMFDENIEQEYHERELNSLTNELESLEKSNQNDLSCSSSVGDPFWQYKSPVHNNQFWSQNLQDLGMCQELGCSDDFNIPDVDVTFRNFEDLLTGDPDLTRALLEDNDPMLEDLEKASMNKFEKSLLETTQVFTVASSISTNKHVNFVKEENSMDHGTHWLSENMLNSPNLIRFSRSATFSGSQLSADSNDSNFLDSGNSGNFRRGESSNSVTELYGLEVKDGEIPIAISKEKKKPRLHGKRTQLAPRKARADVNKRIKNRCAKVQGYESDPANVIKS